MSTETFELLRLGVALLGAFLSMVWLALVLWVYRDIQNRTESTLAVMLSTVLVASTFIPGWAIYMLLRPPQTLTETYREELSERASLLAASDGDLCPRCGTRLHLDYRLCPTCGVEVKQPCDICKRPVRTSWNLCPYCGHANRRPAPREKV